MGSIEEERLAQMVHDFMESESAPLPVSSNCQPIKQQPKSFILKGILSSMTEGETRVIHYVLKHMRSRRESEKTTALKKWLVMKLKVDGFNASLCQNSWVTSVGCPAGDYEYIEITIRDDNGDVARLIVDIDFRSQFELARPTQSYKDLTDTLPSVFVGSEDKLNKIICLLCSAAKQSLKERGLHVPPWRTSAYMQAKWLSPNKLSGTSMHKDNSSANTRDAKNGSNGHGMWSPPPLLKPKKGRDLGGGSALSSQFSSMSINSDTCINTRPILLLF